ncbi:MAG TPA: hypothetical protein VEB64_08750 [Azospirillaceae bacterium]|nr:hypothetical protein [Azospirillaceae bacterium]
MINGDLGALKGLVTSLLSHDRPAAKPAAKEEAPSVSTPSARDPAVTVSSSALGLLRAENAEASDRAQPGRSSFDRFTQRLEKSLASAGTDFSRLLTLMGFDKSETAGAVHDLFGRFADAPGGAPEASPSPDETGTSEVPAGAVGMERTSVTLEIRRISISINQSDRTVSIGVESTRLAVESTRTILPGDATATGGRESSVFSSEERGLFFDAAGLDGTDQQTFLDKLGVMFGNPRELGGFNGRLALRPDPEKGIGDLGGDQGPLNLLLDITEPLLSRTDGGIRKAEEKPAMPAMNADIRA